MAGELPAAVPGAERREIDERSGRLAYYVAGQGRPVLLLHSINAAASAYEVRPIFEHLRHRFRVYAPDLPGFGHSDRSRRHYDRALYVAAIEDMRDEIRAHEGPARPHGLALSLTSEFLARAVLQAPESWRDLTFVNPTGFDRRSADLRETGATREVPGFGAFLGLPGVGTSLFWLLTRKPVIRYFLRRTYGAPEVDEGMVDYDFLSAGQPGAAYAPFAFLSGRLFSKDVRELYEALSLPVYVPHGTRGDFEDFSGAGWTESRPGWTLEAFDSGAMPHFEVPQAFLPRLDAFLDREDR